MCKKQRHKAWGAQLRNNSAAKGLLLSLSSVRLTHMVKGVNQLPKVVLLAPLLHTS